MARVKRGFEYLIEKFTNQNPDKYDPYETPLWSETHGGYRFPSKVERRQYYTDPRASGLGPEEYFEKYGFASVGGAVKKAKVAYNFDEDPYWRAQRTMDSVMDGGGTVAVPRLSYGGKYKKKKFKRRMKNRLNSRILGLANQVLDSHFPLSVHVGGGDTNASLGSQVGPTSGNYVATIDIGQTMDNGAIYPLDGIIYDSTPFGVGLSGTFPYAAPYDYVVSGPSVGVNLSFNHSWEQFIGTAGIGAWKDKEWFELKYEQANICLNIPSMIPSFKCCVYYMLIPAQYNTGSASVGGKGMPVLSYQRAVEVVSQAFGKNWLDRQLPTRFNPQKFDIKLLKKLYIAQKKPSTNMQALVAPTAIGTPVNYLVNMTNNRMYKKWKFKYGTKGLRFYVTNTANAWLSWVPAGNWVVFLGADRTTPLIPVRMVKYYTIPGPPEANPLSESLIKMPWYLTTLLTQTFTWFNIQNTGQFSGGAADDPFAEPPPP